MERSEGIKERLTSLECSVAAARRELSKLRQQMSNMRFMLRNEFDKIKQLCSHGQAMDSPCVIDSSGAARHVVTTKPIERKIDQLSGFAIGHIKSWFKEKNGTPRQATICPEARGVIVLNNVFSNPQHSLEGITEYSHIWIIFLFHKNSSDHTKAKVRPPRLDGKRIGVFASRTPHRPNPIGLTLAKLISISENKLYVSGIDLIDGTPVLDIKPYIPNYDNPITNKATMLTEEAICEPYKVTADDSKLMASNSLKDGIRTADWLNDPPTNTLHVQFTEKAQQQLSTLKCMDDERNVNWQEDTEYSSSLNTTRQAIIHVLQEDPRSVYRRNKCSLDPYKMTVNNINVTCVFTEQNVKIISIEPKHTL